MPAADAENSNSMDITETIHHPSEQDISSSSSFVTSSDVSKTLSYLIRGVELNQPRLLQRAIRQNAKVRRFISPSTLQSALQAAIPLHNSTSTPAIYGIMMNAANKLCASFSSSLSECPTSTPPLAVLPEVEVYLFTLLITTLLRFHLNEDAAYCATALVERIRSFNRR